MSMARLAIPVGSPWTTQVQLSDRELQRWLDRRIEKVNREAHSGQLVLTTSGDGIVLSVQRRQSFGVFGVSLSFQK